MTPEIITSKYSYKKLEIRDGYGFSTPFISVGDDTAGKFIKALLQDDPVAAKSCVSRATLARIDLFEIRSALLSARTYSAPITVEFTAKRDKKVRTSSIMLIEGKQASVLRFNMVSENGKWKIFTVESE